MRPLLWHLEVSTFRGISIGATHFYGRLRGPEINYEISKVLTRAEAKELSDKDDFTWRAGQTTNRFDTRDDVIAAGIVAWRSVAGERDLLIKGLSSRAEPLRPLAGPPEWVVDVARMYKELKEAGFYEGNPKVYGKVLREWDTFLAAHHIQTHSPTYRRDDRITVRTSGDAWEVTEALE